MVKVFGLCATRASTALATSGCGGLEISTICRVAGSASSMSSAISVEMPPTFCERSRPPTPIACEMPWPACAIRQETSCSPVPEAPTMPMSPRGTALAKASGMPLMIAVPQSGPITRRPSARASLLEPHLVFDTTRCRRKASRGARAAPCAPRRRQIRPAPKSARDPASGSRSSAAARRARLPRLRSALERGLESSASAASSALSAASWLWRARRR